MTFCAICISPITGAPVLEPLGRNNALVAVCSGCSQAEPLQPRRRAPVRKEPTTPRAAQIREHRDQLTAEGLCMYGRKHGAATHGRLCKRCWEVSRGRERRV